jgi:cysteine desulfurase/selenocysteine lyase
MKPIRKDFELLKDVIYLDSGATSLTPKIVIDEIKDYYEKYNSNVHRGIYSISEKATEKYEESRKKVSLFINSKPNEIIFTKGTTESLNLLVYSLSNNLQEGDEIVLTQMEHHSNLVPWQQIAKERNLKLKFIKVDKEGKLNLNGEITEKTKIVSVIHVSNVLGTINDVKSICEKARDVGAISIVDAAQSIPRFKIDVKDIGCDFLCFSGHKMLGPTGVGVLYGKYELLKNLKPFLYGGDMIIEVTFKESKWNEIPFKFEAGTPNVSGVIGLGKAIDYLQEIGMENIEEYEKELTEYCLEKLDTIDKVKIYSLKNRCGVISFNVEGVHSHDVCSVLDEYKICIRGGHMCAMPLVREILGENSICRASLYFYNTRADIDKFIEGIKKVKDIFKIL